ncbi:RNA 3'-phosphate cyclase, partial [Candidatus Geothermarchaeota archaeon]
MEPIEIDGSYGEGGGQIVRTALALAALIGKSVKVVNIRAKRPNPGLRPQHLMALKTIAQISSGRISGLDVGSMKVEFYPGEVLSGGDF